MTASYFHLNFIYSILYVFGSDSRSISQGLGEIHRNTNMLRHNTSRVGVSWHGKVIMKVRWRCVSLNKVIQNDSDRCIKI